MELINKKCEKGGENEKRNVFEAISERIRVFGK